MQAACKTKIPERGGNDGADGKARKTQNRFPSLSPRALGNRCRDSHIPPAPVAVVLSIKTKKHKTERSSPLPTTFLQFRLILR